MSEEQRDANGAEQERPQAADDARSVEPEGRHADSAAEAGTPPEAVAKERPKPGAKRKRKKGGEDEPPAPEEIPGAHLEPDLVLEAERAEGDEDEDDFSAILERVREQTGEAEIEAEAEAEAEELEAEAESVEETAAERRERVFDLARGARYQATGKRKTAVARVLVKPGSGRWYLNGRRLEDYLPRIKLQKVVRQPLQVLGLEGRVDVVVKVRGGGVSAQAGAIRHGLARALAGADPALRPELKRRGFLTRDAREVERKKAGLKKARKRPQFSKR